MKSVEEYYYFHVGSYSNHLEWDDLTNETRAWWVGKYKEYTNAAGGH